MTRFLDNSNIEEERKESDDTTEKQPYNTTSHEHYPVLETQSTDIGPNTRIEVLSQHYSDAHTRPNHSKQDFKRIFESINDRLNIPDTPTPAQYTSFQCDGYIELPNVIPADICDALSHRVDLCFDGKFDTNSYPDEWYFRKEICRPDITRHAAYVWKADRGIAQLVLNEGIARFVAHLLDIEGVKVGGDTLWIKPPVGGRTTVSFHRDTMYQPPGALPMATVWCTLTDTTVDNGTLEYVKGSHRWPQVAAVDRDEFLQTRPNDTYRSNAVKEAIRVGVDPNTLEFHQIVMQKGGIVIHNGDTWHGSGPNKSVDKWRRNIGVHYGPHNAQHTPRDGYIHGRYKVGTDNNWNESFFPLTYHQSRKRSAWLDAYLNLDGEDTMKLGQYPQV